MKKSNLTRISAGSIDRLDLTERVASVIREAIFEQRLKPADRIRETQLAQELNISRTPLREALRYLEHEGLIIRKPFRGVFVASMDEGEMRKVFRIRAILESMAIQDARFHLRSTDLAALEDYIKAMKLAVESGDLSEFNRNDMAFHKYIWTMSGDQVLERLLNYLLRQNFVVYNIQTLAFLRREELLDLAETHRGFLDLLKHPRKDPLSKVQKIQNGWLSKITEKLFRKRKAVQR